MRQDGIPSEEKVVVLAGAGGRVEMVGLGSFSPSFFHSAFAPLLGTSLKELIVL